ncbi:MAG: hypothetical protein U1E63_04585 [Burkholderiales bacterium]
MEAVWRMTAWLAAVLVGLGSAAMAAESAVPPTASKELFGWLKAESYKGWEHGSAPHPAPGAHPGGVLAYFNPALATSLRAGSGAHPAGAAAVLELYGSAGKLHGWAVAIKADADSAGGKGWYWYQVYSVEDGNRTLAADRGAPVCVECHAQGRDFVMTSYPPK